MAHAKMPTLQQPYTFITSRYCEDCSNCIITMARGYWGKVMTEIIDYIKNMKSQRFQSNGKYLPKNWRLQGNIDNIKKVGKLYFPGRK